MIRAVACGIAAGFGLIATPRSAESCSLIPWFESASPSFGTYLLARPLPDTLPAGPGTVRYSLAPGHSGRPVERTIYGQLVAVGRDSAAAPADLGEAIAAADGRALLVPWDYDPACQPVPWPRSARWIAEHESGVFVGTLRDRDHWVDGIPTLDVRAPTFAPYPASVSRGSRRSYVGAMLSADELLDLSALVPTAGEMETRLDSALQPLERWARANPMLATRYPAEVILTGARSRVASIRFRRRTLPLAGTYRFVLVFANGDSSVFVARTLANPTSPITQANAGEARRGATRSPIGAFVAACAAATADALPSRCSPGGPEPRRAGFLAFADSARLDSSGRSSVAGGIDFFRFLARSPLDSVQARHLPGIEAHVSRMMREGMIGFLPGRYTADVSGRVTFTWLVEAEGRVLLRVTGERISLVTLLPPRLAP